MKEFNIQAGEGEFIIHLNGDNSKYTVTYDHGQIVFENAGLKYIIPENLGHYATFFNPDPNTGKRKYLLNNVRDLYRDTTPTDFGLGSDIIDAAINSSYFTEEIIVGGINESIPIVAPSGVNIYVNGNIVASGTEVDNGAVVKFEIIANSEFETTTNYNLTVGDITKSFSVTTEVGVLNSCLEWLNKGYSTNGVYKINKLNPTDVYCDMTTDGGGWTLVSYAGSINSTKENTTGKSNKDWMPLLFSWGNVSTNALSTKTSFSRFDLVKNIAKANDEIRFRRTSTQNTIIMPTTNPEWFGRDSGEGQFSITENNRYLPYLKLNDGTGLKTVTNNTKWSYVNSTSGNYPGLDWNVSDGDNCDNCGRSYTSGLNHRSLLYWETNPSANNYSDNQWFHAQPLSLKDSTSPDNSVQDVEIWFRENQHPSSCKDILDSGKSTGNGVYTINPTGLNPMQVYCDMTTNGGGWTLFSSNSSSLTGADASAGAVDAGTVSHDISSVGTRNITTFKWNSLMAVQVENDASESKWIAYENITNTKIIKTEWLDFAGETSANTNAQSTFGHAEIKAYNGSTIQTYTTEAGVVEIHHGSWDANSGTNWILSEKARNPGNGLVNNWEITSHGRSCSINDTNYSSPYSYLYYR